MKAIVTRYHGPTNTRGARISASDHDGHRVTVPYDHALSGADVHAVAVRKLCARLHWTGVLAYGADVKSGGYVWVWLDLSYATTAVTYISNAIEVGS